MVLFERSVEKLGVRYTTMVADGDSKAYDTVNEKLPYGPDYPIVKEECINHVSKRRGTALRNLATDCSKRGLIFKNSRTDMDIIIRRKKQILFILFLLVIAPVCTIFMQYIVHMYILSTTVILLPWTWVTSVIILKFEHHEYMLKNHSLIMDWGTPKEKWNRAIEYCIHVFVWHLWYFSILFLCRRRHWW